MEKDEIILEMNKERLEMKKEIDYLKSQLNCFERTCEELRERLKEKIKRKIEGKE